MATLRLTFACGYYDHFSDLVSGRVAPNGIELGFVQHPQPNEIFRRFLLDDEFDLSELSMAKYASLVSQRDDRFVAIPVFPSRVARHSSLYVRRDGKVQGPADLQGCVIGLPEWAQTAAVYTRGMLMHEHDLDLASVDWVQAGVDKPGRAEKVASRLPSGVRVTARPDKALSDMLVAGEIDAIMAAHVPACFRQNHPNVRRLFEDSGAAERDYVRRTGIFPIMHTVAIRRRVLDVVPRAAASLHAAFEQARRLSVERIFSVGSHVPLPWAYDYALEMRDVFGEEFFPYGVAANRKTLEAFLGFAYEQGVCHTAVTVEELFPLRLDRVNA
jgi:4,5-dihydroxyphthalate decarboxylase